MSSWNSIPIPIKSLILAHACLDKDSSLGTIHNEFSSISLVSKEFRRLLKSQEVRKELLAALGLRVSRIENIFPSLFMIKQLKCPGFPLMMWREYIIIREDLKWYSLVKNNVVVLSRLDKLPSATETYLFIVKEKELFIYRNGYGNEYFCTKIQLRAEDTYLRFYETEENLYILLERRTFQLFNESGKYKITEFERGGSNFGKKGYYKLFKYYPYDKSFCPSTLDFCENNYTIHQPGGRCKEIDVLYFSSIYIGYNPRSKKICWTVNGEYSISIIDDFVYVDLGSRSRIGGIVRDFITGKIFFRGDICAMTRRDDGFGYDLWRRL